MRCGKCFYLVFSFAWVVVCFGFISLSFAENTTPPSFQLIPQSEQVLYLNLQEQGFCMRVLKMERKALIKAHQQLSAKDQLSINEAENLVENALGFRRCIALRELAVALTIPMLKGGSTLYAPYAPQPRLADFASKTGTNLREEIEALREKRVSDRPVDWLEDPMPFETELRLHGAYTELVKLGFCYHMPAIFKDLGRFYDQHFSLANPSSLYGLFAQAKLLNIDTGAMERRLHRVDDAFTPMERVELDRSVTLQSLHSLPEFKQLVALCE